MGLRLDAGEVRNQDEIASREEVARSRVTQVVGMSRLAPETRKHILSLPEIVRRLPVTRRKLRPIETSTDPDGQLREYEKLSVRAHFNRVVLPKSRSKPSKYLFINGTLWYSKILSVST